MAGDWLKMEASTPDKPEVLAITASMGWDDPDLTVGKLFRVWRWFDQQTTNGNAAGVTSALLDRIAGVSGFAQAMQKVGWLIVSEAGIELPNFDKHNGATAKARAQTAKRVASHRASDESNAHSNAPTVTPALAREEKRREEKKEEKQPTVVGAERASPSKGSRLPSDWVIPEEWHIWAASEFPQWPCDHVNTIACDFADYWHAKAGKDAVKTDWFATWRRWCRKAHENVRAPPMSFRERDAAIAAARVHEMTGGLVSAKPPRRDALQEVFDATPRLVG